MNRIESTDPADSPGAFALTAHTVAPGETLHLAVDAGTVFEVVGGTVQIDEPPRWLAQQCVSVRRTLEAGEALVVPQAGWLRVWASGGVGARQWAEVSQWTPRARRHGFMGFMALLAALSTRLRRKGAAEPHRAAASR